MATRRVELRPLSDADLEVLYSWRNMSSFRSYIMSYDDVVTFEEFSGQMERSGVSRPHRYMINRRRDGRPIGFTYAHGHGDNGSTCLLNIYIEDTLAGRGYGVDAFALMTRLLLRTEGMRCVFIDVFAYNTMSLATMRGAGFREVVRQDYVREHEGVEYSVHRFELIGADLPKIESTLESLSPLTGSPSSHATLVRQ